MKKRVAAIYVFLTLVTVLAFWNVGRCGFINYDDPDYITKNVHIQTGLTPEAVWWAFITGHAEKTSQYVPLTWISHMMVSQFFGLDPHWYHRINLLFHIINVLLLFYVLRLLTKTLWQSAFVAALFALHPLHVESVAWISERKDVLSTFFWMLTMIAYYHYVQRPGIRRYLPVFLLFALGLMAKPMLVTLPLVLLFLDYWPMERFEAADSGALNRARIFQLVLEKIPLFALSFLFSAVTYIEHQNGGAIASLSVVPVFSRIKNTLVSYVLYVWKTLWPHNLAFFYPYRGWHFWQAALAALALAAVTFAVIRRARRSPYLAVGQMWYMATLVPVIGLVQVGPQSMADRYMYIPSIGLFIMLAWGVPELLGNRLDKGNGRVPRVVLAVLAVFALSFLGVVTWIQTGYWRNDFTLYEHALAVTNNNYMAYNQLGIARNVVAFLDNGDYYVAQGRLKHALNDYDQAVDIGPGNAAAYRKRGVVYELTGRHAQAIADYDMAISIDPQYAGAYRDRAVTYYRLGRPGSALADLKKAAALGDKKAQSFLKSNGIN